MGARWEAVTAGLEHGGYVAWETAVDAVRGDRGRDHVPLFVKLAPGKGMSMAAAIDATLALPGLRLSRHERDLLASERALGTGSDVRCVVFWPRARLAELPAWWDVLQVGPALAIATDVEPGAGTNLAQVAGDLDRHTPVVGIVDDGIGFLNARFRRDPGHTRFRAVWVQAAERLGPAGEVLCGQVRDRAEIDRLLAEAGDEAQVYRALNRGLFAVTDRPLTNGAVAHGTHVLDLAAGAAPWDSDPLTAVPLLAVQLPPASIRDTAGRRMETYLVQGLRWILAEVFRQANGTDVPPVVINVSLGSLAGPGDRHAFLADWFDHEVARHRRMTGGEVRLVVAYGNARLGRLVARDVLRRSGPMVLDWRVQPDDHTSSFLELRADLNQAASLRLRLVPPASASLPALDVPWPDPGTGWRLSGPIAAVTASEDGGQRHLHIALGPTAGTEAMTPAPSGLWTVEVHTTDIEPLRVTARVQRDDTPPGYRMLGRQSWLDHPQGWDWDEELRAYLAPRPAADAPGCPVTREGSAVAYAGATADEVLFVGAGRPVTGDPGQLQPARYSSEGVRYLERPGESRGPTLVARGDAGAALTGIAASGVVSGSIVRMSGTSMAAPQVVRALARYFLATPEADRTPERERIALTGSAAWTEPDQRMGHGALIG